ncbi:MAG: pyrroline-5-carboxylate reductase [Treponema sp.]|nr:pyrroline-5-carboxylate reductase [Treponema sp.]
MQKTIACIGSGNMGTALMKVAAKVVGGANIGFSDVERGKAEMVARQLGAKVYASNSEAAADADFVFLAVKPQVMVSILVELAPLVEQRLTARLPVTLVSMAAGWSIGKLRAALFDTVGQPIVRIMPNTPALIGQGVIALAAENVAEETLAELEIILAGAGMVDRLSEGYLDAVTALSGSGPAFVCMFIEALADGAVRAGLPRDRALCYAGKTVAGSAAMMLETRKHPGELKDMVSSPAGTTIAGIAALENGAFRGVVMNAVEATFRRAKELG